MKILAWYIIEIHLLKFNNVSYESFRMDDRVRHRCIIGLGKLEGLQEEQIKLLGRRMENLLTHQSPCLPLAEAAQKVEELSRHYFNEIKRKGRYDIGKKAKIGKPWIYRP